MTHKEMFPVQPLLDNARNAALKMKKKEKLDNRWTYFSQLGKRGDVATPTST